MVVVVGKRCVVVVMVGEGCVVVVGVVWEGCVGVMVVVVGLKEGQLTLRDRSMGRSKAGSNARSSTWFTSSQKKSSVTLMTTSVLSRMHCK